MEANMVLSLENYQKDFILFQENLEKLRKTNTNQFVAFKDGKVISAKESIDKVKEDLITQGIEPSGTVIEFVSKDEIYVVL